MAVIKAKRTNKGYVFDEESIEKVKYVNNLLSEGLEKDTIKEGLLLWNSVTKELDEELEVFNQPLVEKKEEKDPYLIVQALLKSLTIIICVLILKTPADKYIEYLNKETSNYILIYNEDTEEFLKYYQQFKKWKEENKR